MATERFLVEQIASGDVVVQPGDRVTMLIKSGKRWPE